MGKSQNQTAIYDARKELGYSKVAILGLQHLFAMFGATVLVPIIFLLWNSVSPHRYWKASEYPSQTTFVSGSWSKT